MWFLDVVFKVFMLCEFISVIIIIIIGVIVIIIIISVIIIVSSVVIIISVSVISVIIIISVSVISVIIIIIIIIINIIIIIIAVIINVLSCLTAHNWQKWKSTFLTCPCHEIYRVEAVGLQNSNYTFKNYDFCEYVKFGAISWNFDILSITA